jgi:4-amino-4-deoxy-L-arabinose transferase-like glycosyltransferase
MKRSWFLAGLIIYILLAAVIFPFVIGVPAEFVFGSDAIGYSKGAINLLQHGFYSFDGVTPFMEREPGMSFFLVPIYFFFGTENVVAFSIVQATFFFLAASAFYSQLRRKTGTRAAGITFLLLLTSGSVFHTIFSAYRENLTLSLLLFFGALFLSSEYRRAWWKIVAMGLLFGAAILTYYPLIFFPPVLLFVCWRQQRSLRDAAIIILLCYALVGRWALRNYGYTDKLQVIDSRRTGVMWYVRGEQAEHVKGFEPFLCLWAEYVSRDWTNRAHACSFNGLMHERWPASDTPATDYGAAGASGRAKIMAHPISYLWFSFVDIFELHLPFLGGGWSHAYNVYAAATMFFLYIGFFIGLPSLFRRENLLWLLLIGYNTAIFALTDATPRYLLPVIFCYALIAGIGYDRALKYFHKRFS